MSRCWIFQCRCSWRSLLRASRCHCQTTRRYSPHSWSNQSHRQGDPVVLRTNHGISTRPWCGAERGRAKACPAARAETGRAGPGPDATKLLASRHQNLKKNLQQWTRRGHQNGVETPEWEHPPATRITAVETPGTEQVSNPRSFWGNQAPFSSWNFEKFWKKRCDKVFSANRTAWAVKATSAK